MDAKAAEVFMSLERIEVKKRSHEYLNWSPRSGVQLSEEHASQGRRPDSSKCGSRSVE